MTIPEPSSPAVDTVSLNPIAFAQCGMGLSSMVKKLARTAGWVFALVFIWRLALLLFASLPVPSNDSFFYDGPVVNLLLHGKYANPSLALALPISGREVFCAYPPLYQAALLGWMSLCGASVISAMAFHLALFGLYLIILFAISRRLGLPAWALQLGGLFLLVITFDDRPDSLAHLFGIAAVYHGFGPGKIPYRSRDPPPVGSGP